MTVKQINATLPLKVLGGISAETFFREYWHKKPLLIRKGFVDFKDPIAPDEMAGLALESDIPSRLIMEQGGTKPWEVSVGPFDEQFFEKLPDTHWSLILNDVEKFLPELKAISDQFRFIPDWRFDDLQVSYAAPEGTAGPHWDDYDVFMLQGLGKKTWQISYDPVSEEDFLEGVDIRLIENFKVDEEWVVEPGDIIYLPPRIGHYGRAIGESVTWSIGFRAPKHIEMVNAFADELCNFVPTDVRFSDPDLVPQMHPAEISDASIDHVAKIIQDALANDREMIGDWLGRYMSEAKAMQEPEPLEEEFTETDLLDLLNEGVDIERDSAARFFYRMSLDEVILYTNGACFALPKKHKELIEYICLETAYSASKLSKFTKDPIALAFLLDLFNQGLLYCYEGDDAEHEHN